MSKDDTRAWVDAILDVLGKAIVEEDVVIYGFGSFKHKARAPRVGRNVYTGERVNIPARTAITFELSEKLFNELNPKEEGDVDVESNEPED